MDYQKHYDLLINRAKTRILESTYIEHHHVLPTCVGGTDNNDNIVALTPEEHYLAHQLLVKIYDKLGKKANANKLAYALNLMSANSNINRSNKYYGWIRRRVSEARRGYQPTEETLSLISKNVKAYFAENGHHNKGIVHTDEYKKKMSERLMGREFSDDHKLKISLALKGKPKSKAHKQKFQGKNNPSYYEVAEYIKPKVIDDFLHGQSLNTIINNYDIGYGKVCEILTNHNINPSVRTCIHCGITGNTSNMLRWHFDNCKQKK